MRRIIIGFAIVIAMVAGRPALAQEADIQSTIDQQITAFLADDFENAFQYASPGLRRLFQTPENFGRMVTQGYPMVWRPADVRYLELEDRGGVLWQRVMITDEQGTVHILDYRMLETSQGWRINGVQILDSSELAV